MSEQFYGLREPPFAVAPDVRFAVIGPALQDALDQLEYEVLKGSGGIVLLTGETGSGKTLVAQCLLQRLAEHDVRVARVLHSRLTPSELLQTVCDRLRVPIEEPGQTTNAALIEALSAFLMDIYAQGQRVLLVVDEAQNLSDEALEQLRLLTNLETPAHKLIHILLLGTPALGERLQASPQLALRVAARHVLEPMTFEQSEVYVRHRIQAAGGERVPFTRLAIRSMHHYARGLPGTLNRVGERALALGAAAGETSIGETIVERAARDVLPGHVGYLLRRYRAWWLVAGAALLLLVVVMLVKVLSPAKPPQADAPVPATTSPDLQADVRALQEALPAAATARMQAWSELLARWQVGSRDASVSQAAACTAVIFPGFDCVGGTGTLNQLRRFDRPLVLELAAADGPRQVLLLGIGEQDVRLLIGAHERRIPRQVLAQSWQGRFFAPFRLPPGLPATLRRGDVGTGVAWLDSRLRIVDGDRGAVYRPAVFDAAMERRVRRLQRSFGIPDDGIVGPETFFALMSLDDAGPHLAHNVP